MVKTDDLSALSDEDLMNQWTEEAEANAASRELLTAYSKEHQRRNRAAQLQAALGDLSDEDKALIQSMEPVGIESQEQVGSDV